MIGMNEESGGKQVWLRNGWYEKDGTRIDQPMSYQGPNNSRAQKGIQQVLLKNKSFATKRVKCGISEA